MSTRTRIAAVALAVLALPSLAGCWSGKDANTNVQATMNSGNGVEQRVGGIDVENAQLVLGPEGSNSATLLASFIDVSRKGDKLIGAAINGKPAPIYVNGAVVPSLDIPPASTVKIGWGASNYINSYDLGAAVSTYVPVELVFERNGIAKLSLLIVAPIGQYEGIMPAPASPPAS